MAQEETLTCPVCKESFPSSENSCPRCGFRLAGVTESFSPVSSEQVESKAAAGGTVPALVVDKGPYAGEKFDLGDGVFTIGRDPKCDIFLSNMTVSRLHATITLSGESASIVDEGSLNGTWVDGTVIDRAPLHSGSKVQIGIFEMTFKYLNGLS